MLLFRDRKDAGRKLAKVLVKHGKEKPIVLALPRGGVPVGYEIAKKLGAPLDVLVVRKLGAPSQPEFGIGAIAPGEVRVLDEEAISRLGISREEVSDVEHKEKAELKRRIKKYRGRNPFPSLKDKTVILVDDGLATGITAQAAVKSLLAQDPAKLIIAIPVCSTESVESLRWAIRPEKDQIFCLFEPAQFQAIGAWYENFDQVSDEDVISLLNKSKMYN